MASDIFALIRNNSWPRFCIIRLPGYLRSRWKIQTQSIL